MPVAGIRARAGHRECLRAIPRFARGSHAGSGRRLGTDRVDWQSHLLHQDLSQDLHCRLWSLLGRDYALSQPVGENESQNPATAVGLADQKPARGIHPRGKVWRQLHVAESIEQIVALPVLEIPIGVVEQLHDFQIVALERKRVRLERHPLFNQLVQGPSKLGNRGPRVGRPRLQCFLSPSILALVENRSRKFTRRLKCDVIRSTDR